MHALTLPPHKPDPPSTPEELFGRLHVLDTGLENLWSHQADTLRAYSDSYVDTPDVALELPTGSGKTLVGLLIAEWRRQTHEQRCAFVCPTNQLARQIHGKAIGYGIDAALLIGASNGWDPAELSRFNRSETIAITNYHHIFNRTPRIDAQTLVLDDAHTAEGPVADRWSLRLGRSDAREAYFGVLDIVAASLPEHHARALRNDALDPLHRSRVQIVLPDAVFLAREALAAVLAEHVEGTDNWYPWDAIEGSVGTCLLYASWNEILLRPFIAPTFSQRSLADASQRVYLSATLGAGGELERSFGRARIHRIPRSSDWDHEGSGRRYMMIPSAGRDGGAATALIREVIDSVGRVLILAPSAHRRDAAGDALLPSDFTRFGAQDVEESLDPFTTSDRSALLLANRYDGIDLPGTACHLIVMAGLPSGTHQQERFLFGVLRAEHALSERIRTRITQGVGRATRGRRDTAVVCIHGDDLVSFLGQTEERDVLRSEIQAELELAFSVAEEPYDELISSVDSFLAQDKDWQPNEKWLRGYAQEHERRDAEGATHLADAAKYEIDAWEAAWRGDFATALQHAQSAASALNHPTMTPYRAFWLSLAASWSTIARGANEPLTVALVKDVGNATRRMSWRPEFAKGIVETTPDDALAVRAVNAVDWNLKRRGSAKLERDLVELEGWIKGTEATPFELGIERLGTLLGFESKRPAAPSAPDGVWRDGSKSLMIWEAKTEELDSGPLSTTEIRQANSHANWIESNFGWPQSGQTVTLIVTEKTRIHSDAVGIAQDDLFLLSPSVVREITSEVVAIHRQLASELVGMSVDVGQERAARLLNTSRLTTPQLVDRLAVKPLNTVES